MKRYLEIKKLLKSYGFKKIFLAGIMEIYRKLWLELINNTYSQNGEDKIVEKIFPVNYVGKYMEIGAYHPSRLSNVYKFYKKGWTGIVVEPNPEVKDLFNKLRPKDKFYNLGISDRKGTINYYQFLIPALNTFSKYEADKNIKNGHKLEKIIKVKTKIITDLEETNIDFLSVDTEGFDEKILKSWNWKKCRPRAVCVEKNNKEILGFMQKVGYKLCEETRYNWVLELNI